MRVSIRRIRRTLLGTKQISKPRTKAYAAHQLIVLKAREGSLHDQSSGVLAQGAPPNLCGVFACSMGHLPSTLSVGRGLGMEASPTSGKAERARTREFLGGPLQPPRPPLTSLSGDRDRGLGPAPSVPGPGALPAPTFCPGEVGSILTSWGTFHDLQG